MIVELDAGTERRIQRRVQDGTFRDAIEAVQEAIRQMDEREQRLTELRDALAIGEEQIARGEVIQWTPELAAEILTDAKRAAAEGRKPKADVVP